MMSAGPSLPRSAPIGAILLLLLAGTFYFGIIATLGYRFSPVEFDAGGESRVAEGLSEVYLIVVTVLLWIVLAVLLFIGARKGEVPGWVAIIAIVLLPLSGVAAFFATKLYWYYAGWAIVVPVLLPPLVAFYAIWARSPQLHAALPANITSLATWGAVLVLTIAPVLLSSVDRVAFSAQREDQLKAAATQSAQAAAAKKAARDRGVRALEPRLIAARLPQLYRGAEPRTLAPLCTGIGRGAPSEESAGRCRNLAERGEAAAAGGTLATRRRSDSRAVQLIRRRAARGGVEARSFKFRLQCRAAQR